MAKGAFAASRGVGRATPQPCPGKCLVGERQSDGASTRLPKSVLATSQPWSFSSGRSPCLCQRRFNMESLAGWSQTAALWHSGRPIRRIGGPRDSRDLGFLRMRRTRRAGRRPLRVPQGAVCDQPARAAPRRAAAGGICANDGLTERPQGAVCGHGAAARGPKAFRRATCWPLRRAVRGALRWAARSPA